MLQILAFVLWSPIDRPNVFHEYTNTLYTLPSPLTRSTPCNNDYITDVLVIGTMSSADGNLVIKCPPEVYFVARSIAIPMLHASPRIRGASKPRAIMHVKHERVACRRATSSGFVSFFFFFFFFFLRSQLFLLINSNWSRRFVFL